MDEWTDTLVVNSMLEIDYIRLGRQNGESNLIKLESLLWEHLHAHDENPHYDLLGTLVLCKALVSCGRLSGDGDTTVKEGFDKLYQVLAEISRYKTYTTTPMDDEGLKLHADLLAFLNALIRQIRFATYMETPHLCFLAPR